MTDQQESFELDELEDVLLFKEVDLGSIQDILENCPVAKFKKEEVVLSAGETKPFDSSAPFWPVACSTRTFSAAHCPAGTWRVGG